MAQILDHLRSTATPQPIEDFLTSGSMLTPVIDVAETETGLEISADVPGATEENLDVTIQGDTLVIKGGKGSRSGKKEKDYHLVERRYASFRRHIPLGFVPDAGAVKAEFKNGVLKLTIDRPANAPASVQKVSVGKS